MKFICCLQSLQRVVPGAMYAFGFFGSGRSSSFNRLMCLSIRSIRISVMVRFELMVSIAVSSKSMRSFVFMFCLS